MNRYIRQQTICSSIADDASTLVWQTVILIIKLAVEQGVFIAIAVDPIHGKEFGDRAKLRIPS